DRLLRAAVPAAHPRADQHLRRAGHHPGRRRRVAGRGAARRAPVCHRGADADREGRDHPGTAAPDRPRARHTAHDRHRARRVSVDGARRGAGRTRHRGCAADHARRGDARPRGPRLRVVGGAARAADDDHAADRDHPGDRLPVDGERPDPRRRRHRRHAAGGGDHRRLPRAGDLLRLRRVRLPHPRALRQPRRQPSRPRRRSPAVIHDLATTAGAAILLPLFAALVLGLVPSWRVGAVVNAVAATLTFAVVTFLPRSIGQSGPLLLVDRLAVHLSLLTAFVAMTASWFSTAYVRVEVSQRRLNKARLRQYHAMFQLFCGALLAVLLGNNLGITWVAIEAATIAAALVIGLPRTAHAVEASWKFFVLCGSGIALALFGTIVLYLAALPALGP